MGSLHKIIGFFLVILLMPILTTADYSYYTHGNGNANNNYILGNVPDTWTQVEPPTPDTGSLTDPVVFDLDGDGTNEVFLYAGNNVISVLDGDDPSNEQTAIALGDPGLSPTVCDVDNDGTREYVGVFQNTTRQLVSVSFDGDDVTLEANLTLANQTNLYGRVVCGQFYLPQGDSKYYAMFTDANRFLHIAHVTGGAWSDQRINIGVAEEAGEGNPFNQFIDPVYSENFDPGGENAIAFVAGHKLYVYYSDGSEDDFDFESEMNGDGVGVALHVVPQPSGNDRFLITTTFDTEETLHAVKVRRTSFLGVDTLTQDDDVITFTVPNNQDAEHYTWAVAPWENNDSQADIIMFGNAGSAGTGFQTNMRVYNGNDHSLQYQYNSDACEEVDTGAENQAGYVLDMDGDFDLDILYMCQNAPGSGNERMLFYQQGPNLTTNITLYSFAEADITGLRTPIPVDVNKDGYLDLVYTYPTRTTFFMSSTSPTTSEELPFEVEFYAGEEETDRVTAVQRVTTLYDTDNYVFNYAVLCSIETEAVWYETFGVQYNFTPQNVSLNVVPPEDLLTFQGITFTINSTVTSFDLLKTANEGVRDYFDLEFSFTTSGNRTIDILGFSDTNLITEWWQLEKTNTNLSFYSVNSFNFTRQLVGSLTVAQNSATNFVQIRHTPERDEALNKNTFDIEVIINNVSRGTYTTAFWSGENLKDVEVYTADNGTTTIKNLGLKLVPDFMPGNTQFQNGVSTTVLGVTVESPSPAGDSISGDGYEVRPDFNEVFYSACTYDLPGTYTQRHFILPVNDGTDYSNYIDLEVEVTGEPTSPFDDEGASLSDDELVEQTNEFLALLGLGTPFGRFIAGMIIIIIMSWFGFSVHPALGFIMFCLGAIGAVLIGWWPLWVVVVMVIMGATAVTVTLRRVFVGGN